VDLRDLAHQTIVLLGPLAEKRQVALRLAEADRPVVACIDAAQVQQVLTNLVMNAMQAMPDGGSVTIRLGTERAAPPEQSAESASDGAFIAVQDQGTGIRAEDLPHIFEPFFTTKKTGEGTGLGLSIAQGIIQEHGGWISVDSREGAGSCFTIHILKDPACLEKS
jgi:signal transduction histidine kinase